EQVKAWTPTVAHSKNGVNSSSPHSSQQLVCFGGENEIAFCQSVYLVRPDCQLHFAPSQVNVRVMALGFGQLADFISEVQCVTKVFEFILLFQMMFFHYLPAAIQLCCHFGQFLSF